MRRGLGSEHPLCDRIQPVIVVLFFVSWGLDSLSHFIFGFSTVVLDAVSFPPLLLGTIVFLCIGSYLVSKAHKAVLDEGHTQLKLADSGVYAVVKHPMYLGTLLFCLSFRFISFSLLSIGIWIAFFTFYDRMATYEERSLIRILGEEYSAYQKKLQNGFPDCTDINYSLSNGPKKSHSNSSRSLPDLASSFLYIALTDLYPELHHEARFPYTLRQFTMMLAGIGTILLLLQFHTH